MLVKNIRIEKFEMLTFLADFDKWEVHYYKIPIFKEVHVKTKFVSICISCCSSNVV